MAKKTWDRSPDGLMPQAGLKLRDALDSAARMGCTFRNLGNGDGEISHPQMAETCSFGLKKNSTLPYVISWTRKLWKLRKELREQALAGKAVVVIAAPPSAPCRRPSSTGASKPAETPKAEPKKPAKAPSKTQKQAEKKAEPKKPEAKKPDSKKKPK